MTWPQRFLLSLVTVLAMLFALSLCGYDRWRSIDADAQVLPPSKYDKRVSELDREAIEEAYKNQIIHLFEIWMKDERGQPQRAVTGARQARRAYVGAMTEIDKREGRPP